MSRPPIDGRKTFGIAEWFRVGEHQRVEAALAGIRQAGAVSLRTHLSWADFHTPQGLKWYDWLIPTVGSQIDLLPCVHFTPPSLSRTGRASGPPRRTRDFADFVDQVLTRYGRHFEYIELWNEPNNLLDWDWRADTDWHLFCDMVGSAAYWSERRGWKAVLGGPCPFDAHWLSLMGERGVLGVVSAVGIHGFPGIWDSEGAGWSGWNAQIGELRRILDRHNPSAEIWITETGCATWKHNEVEQLGRFLDVLAAPAQRVYWYGWQDIARDVAVQDGVFLDPRHYHFGLVEADGRRKLLGRLLTEGGVEKVAAVCELQKPQLMLPAQPIVILGGAGFIGCNLADSYLAEGRDVLVIDNLARPGVEANLAWLRECHGDNLHVALSDTRDDSAMREALDGAAAVFQLAAQVAVTTSLVDPIDDFSVNAEGTLKILEILRRKDRPVPLIFASTNKVYGTLEQMEIARLDDCFLPADAELRAHGIAEDADLDFCTPYGCSKGVADQYVLDYARSYGMPTAVLRMSCIYGPRQFGTEDQGWIAHFLIRALNGEGITIYGDGRQVRDILHIADAVAAYRAVLERIETVKGEAFNLGGGPSNAVSLRMVLHEIAQILGRQVTVNHDEWRTGDQFYFVADTRKLQQRVNWQVQIGWRDGIRDLAEWIGRFRAQANRRAIAEQERLRA